MSTQEFKSIGWANTIKTVAAMPREMWNSIMTIEHSPLRKLDPRVSHMVFQMLAFMWSGIFAVMIGSVTAFGISAVGHLVFIAGVFITAYVFNKADTKPQDMNSVFKLRTDGYHSVSRTRQFMWIDGQKIKLDPKDPGGEHE
jgi:hypothetical protein